MTSNIMTMNEFARRSPLALAILSLLVEAPMHPYRMQQLIKQREKDAVINVRLRASLYQSIERLLRAELIAVQETGRDENRPERTVYRLTERGSETARAWMREMLSTPAREFPEFPAALAHLPLLAPEEVLKGLEQRAEVLAEEIADLESRLHVSESFLPRLFVVEGEYLLAMRQAEQQWVRALIDDLRAGRLTWDEAWLAEVARRLSPARPDTEVQP
jgi:DNA-binding PadR family transcriptional regulator